MHIQVVGPGCARCQTLAKLCQAAVDKAGIEAEVEKVTDINRFADLGVLMTPGLLIDGELVSTGRLPAASEIDRWLGDRQGGA